MNARKILIVHAHPEKQSFNGALLRATIDALRETGDKGRISDLYAMAFDPVSDRRNFVTEKDAGVFRQQTEEMHASEHDGFALDIKTEHEKLAWCDALIFQFPLWWFGLPAILKGWVDRVFAMGRIYGGGRWYDNGVFRGKRAVCCVTTGGPAPMYQPDGLNGDIHAILQPIQHGMLYFVGFDVLPPFVVHAPSRLRDDERVASIEAWKERVKRMFDDAPIAYPRLAEFGPDFRRKR